MQVENITPVTREILDQMLAQQSSVVVAGHYCLADHMQELSAECDAEAKSFEVGARLVVEALRQDRESHMILWVNDIGIEAEQRAFIKHHYELPENYQTIMERVGLPKEHLLVMFESATRNKASTLLRNIYKRRPQLFEKVSASSENLVRCVQSSVCGMEPRGAETAYVVAGPDAERLVVKEGSNPKCNFILATLFNELRQIFAPQLQINVFNNIYRYRLQLGIHVSRQVLENTTPFHNVFCDGDAVLCEPFPNTFR